MFNLVVLSKMKSAAQPDRTAASESSAPPELVAALDLLWARFLPDFRQRTDVLGAAAKACANSRLSASQCEAARAAAHKLAGTLGTFNLPRGTVLARELELAFSSQVPPEPVLAEHLASIAAELRTIIDGRK